MAKLITHLTNRLKAIIGLIVIIMLDQMVLKMQEAQDEADQTI